MEQESPPPVQLMQLLFGFAASRAIGVAAELCIADKLKDGAKTAEELARQTESHPRSLYRVLRACASVGVFSEDHAKRFSLTPVAEPLLSDAPGSLRAFSEMITNEMSFDMWAHLLESVQTGNPVFEKVFGQSLFGYIQTHPKIARLFNDAMTSNSAFATEAVLSSYDFSAFSQIVDVGGGHGILLASILKRYPHSKGVLFDVPDVAAEAKRLMDSYEVAERCTIAGGDFFKAVPEGGDVYVLKHIIHDWDDEQCVTILKNCRTAAKKGGKLLIIEMLLPEGNEPSLSKFLDLNMMLASPGCERTQREYEMLFKKAGFKLSSVTPTPSPFSIIEGIVV